MKKSPPESASLLAIEQKHSGFFVQVALEAFPSSNILADNQFVFAGKIAGHTEARGGVEVLAKVLQHGIVAEGCFDEELGLVVGRRAAFQVFDGVLSFRTFDR